jgi:hypothetical protein
MIGGVTIGWFLLKLLLLAVIAWQIGIGIKRHWRLTLNEKVLGAVSASLALVLGLATGYIRFLDHSSFGWGWIFEVVTSVAATIIVLKWITLDLTTIRQKWSGYPRRVFLKSIFSNSLILAFWASVMMQQGFDSGAWWARNAGLSFNVLVGNVMYLVYWLAYEYHRKTQTTRA